MILLDTPYQTGDFDLNGPYTHIKISCFKFDSINKKMEVEVINGYLNLNGDFTKGVKTPLVYVIIDKPTEIPSSYDFTELFLQPPVAGETIYVAASRVLYQYLIDKGHYPGTIV